MAGVKGKSGGKREGAGSGGPRTGAGRKPKTFSVKVGDQLLVQRPNTLSELWQIASMDRTHIYIDVIQNGQVVETIKIIR